MKYAHVLKNEKVLNMKQRKHQVCTCAKETILLIPHRSIGMSNTFKSYVRDTKVSVCKLLNESTAVVTFHEITYY